MPRKRIHANDAARVAAHRKAHDLVPLSVDIPKAISDGLVEYMRFKNLTKADVIVKLIKSQLLRKR